MADNTIRHWTDDEQLLSQFILHRIAEADAKPLVAHLESCSACQEIVENERRVAAGAKLAGRTALKKRLRSRISALPRESVGGKAGIPWARVTGIAAVFLIAISVGVYNNWFVGTGPVEVVKDEATGPLADQRMASTSLDTAGTMTAQESQRESDVPESTALSGGYVAAAASPPDDEKPVAANELMASKEEERQTEPGADQAAFADKRAGSELKTENESTVGLAAAGSSPQVFWVEGRVLPSGEQMRNDALGKNSNEYRQRAEASAKVKKDSGERDNVAANTTGFSVNQMPSSSLPALQQKQNQRGVVQTLIENNANGIRLTIYLDSLMADSELQNADLEAIGNDSLILNISNQQIGYKLPPDLQGQVNTKNRR